jgi:hypothetical protein
MGAVPLQASRLREQDMKANLRAGRLGLDRQVLRREVLDHKDWFFITGHRCMILSVAFPKP